MIVLALKATGLWLLIMLAAIGNGVFRQHLFEPAIGRELALPLSGILLSLIIFSMSWLLIPLLGRASDLTWFAIGLLWVVLTLMFEFLFGYFVAGLPLHVINQVFDMTNGNLFLLALLAAGLPPRLAAGLRGLVD